MVKALLMTTKRIAGIILILSISGWINQTEPSEKLNESCAAFNQIQIDIRDNVISPDSARAAGKGGQQHGQEDDLRRARWQRGLAQHRSSLL